MKNFIKKLKKQEDDQILKSILEEHKKKYESEKEQQIHILKQKLEELLKK